MTKFPSIKFKSMKRREKVEQGNLIELERSASGLFHAITVSDIVNELNIYRKLLSVDKYRQLHDRLRTFVGKSTEQCDVGFADRVIKEYPELRDVRADPIFDLIKVSLERENYYMTESEYGGYSGLHCHHQWDRRQLSSTVTNVIFFDLLNFDITNGGNLQKIFTTACSNGAYK